MLESLDVTLSAQTNSPSLESLLISSEPLMQSIYQMQSSNHSLVLFEHLKHLTLGIDTVNSNIVYAVIDMFLNVICYV